MKILQIYASEERIKLPKEDAWTIDRKHKVFAVADGVHLKKGIEYKGKYPHPSPAGKLAQRFCDVFVKSARKGTMRDAFRSANRAVSVFNKNRDKYSVFEHASCYYAATAAFMRFRGKYVEYGNICDAGVAAIDKSGKFLLWNRDHSHHHIFDLSGYAVSDQSYLLRTVFRNTVGSRREKKGYGVVTGEKEAEIYAHHGRTALRRGVIYLLATDGFEAYLRDRAFRKALYDMDKNRLENVMARLKRAHKNSGEFVSERTLIAIKQ